MMPVQQRGFQGRAARLSKTLSALATAALLLTAPALTRAAGAGEIPTFAAASPSTGRAISG